MDIYVRQAKQSDREEAVYVESQSTPNLRYLDRMWDRFTESVDEPLFIAFYKGEMAGVGKLSILYDGSAWLETLRVDKKFQGKGVGKAIYKSYLSHAKNLDLYALRMYTGVNNAASAGLARINGFKLAGQYSGADLSLESYTVTKDIPAFEKVTNQRFANDLLLPLGKKWGNSLVLNRTFYPYNESLINGLVADGLVYYHKESESTVVLGSRFMPERGLNIGIMSGDYNKCIKFASYYTYLIGLPKLTIMWPPELVEVKNELLENNFTMQPSDCIVMERKL
ncbi:MAG: GNAT family N-acetyltransferase [Clostridia bacterium]